MAVVAALATFTLCMLLRARTREKRLRRREDRLRRRIGGEMKLEEWIVCPPAQAHLETARLLAAARPLRIGQANEAGALCALPDQGIRALVACAQLHRAEKLSTRDIGAFQRACRACGAETGYLCGADADAAARAQAEMPPLIRLVDRERMIALAGASHPATDRQLVALGRRMAGRHSLRALLRGVLDHRRAEKYLLYGLMLLTLYLFAGSAVYAVTGIACLLLMAFCRAADGRDAPV